MDREQRQRITDIFCEEWKASGRDIDCRPIYERLLDEDKRLQNDEFQEFMRELISTNLMSGIIYPGNVRITDVDPALCEYPLKF
ncbi:MAG: hypothetical protein M3305_10795 [Actinomycetota bacterium]|nr:hypothetical protein [Actinomycetota bacterium]